MTLELAGLFVCCGALAVMWFREHLENRRLRAELVRARPTRRARFRVVRTCEDRKH